MAAKNKKIIVILTYNSFFGLKKGIYKIRGHYILILTHTFNPKCPENVVPTDPNWKMVIDNLENIEKIFIFAGKKSSGALEIIELACKLFADKKEALFFALCHHDLGKKEMLLESYRIPHEQYVCFEDGHLPCEESPQLLAYLLEYLHRVYKISLMKLFFNFKSSV